jgi:2-polyprenyl-3-methyl-5-hydroxy-6-metoxy-1,4-benzoquinol methylase
MRERIKKIINEIKRLGDKTEKIPNLISGGYLDSFETLILINSLELEFKVKFDFSDNLVKNLDSLDKIENLLKSKGVKEVSRNPQDEWENAYGSDSFRQKNKYPYSEVVSFIMGNFGNIEDKSKIKILDLGCGWGNNLVFLKDQGFDYYGIDFSKRAVEHCKGLFKNVIFGDISELPYQSDFFDCVFDRMSIQHNPKEKIKKIFSEAHRVLKKEGLFFSILVAKANFDFFTTYLLKKEIKELAKPLFRELKLDYMEHSTNNGTEVYKSNLLTAKK